MSIKLTWFGHAALGLEIGGYKLLVDPYFTGNAAASVNPDTLSPDFILITHGHTDHFGSARDLRARTGAPVAVPAADSVALRRGVNPPEWNPPAAGPPGRAGRSTGRPRR